MNIKLILNIISTCVLYFGVTNIGWAAYIAPTGGSLYTYSFIDYNGDTVNTNTLAAYGSFASAARTYDPFPNIPDDPNAYTETSISGNTGLNSLEVSGVVKTYSNYPIGGGGNGYGNISFDLVGSGQAIINWSGEGSTSAHLYNSAGISVFDGLSAMGCAFTYCKDGFYSSELDLASGSYNLTFDVASFRASGIENPGNFSFSMSVVPVPASVWLFFSGLVGLVGFARREKT